MAQAPTGGRGGGAGPLAGGAPAQPQQPGGAIRITLPEIGTVEFPSGLDPVGIANVVAEVSRRSPTAGLALRQAIDAAPGRSDPRSAFEKLQDFAYNAMGRMRGAGAVGGAVAGGELGSPLGPWGTAGGAIIGAGLGSFGGSKAEGASTPDAARGALVDAAITAPFEAAPFLAAPVKAGARRLWLTAAKPIKSVVEDTNAVRLGGSLLGGKHEIAETVLSRGRGALTQGNAEALQNELTQAGAQTENILRQKSRSPLATPPGGRGPTPIGRMLPGAAPGAAAGAGGTTIDRSLLEEAFQSRVKSVFDELQKAGYTTAQLQEHLDALKPIYDQIQNMPEQIPVINVPAIVNSMNQHIGGFGPGTSNLIGDTVSTVAKAVRGTANDAMKDAVPEAADLLGQQSDLIPATAAVDQATSRTANHTPFGSMSDVVAAAAGLGVGEATGHEGLTLPTYALARYLARDVPRSRASQVLYNLGVGFGKPGTQQYAPIGAAAVRSALLNLLSSGSDTSAGQ